MPTDLRWISLLLFDALVIRKSGQFFFDDLGGLRTFALTDIESHFEVLAGLCQKYRADKVSQEDCKKKNVAPASVVAPCSSKDMVCFRDFAFASSYNLL